MTDGPLTLVSVITSPSRDRECIAHSRAWHIPTEQVEAFAQAMAERFGPPIHESVSTVGSMVDAADRDADKILFYDPEETPDA
ncbi:MAG: hypothetical protein JWO67_6385 [Streptosporangiaceae bacterium]|nr:hypothetical protein [Streptosporangiaceae bacterium]